MAAVSVSPADAELIAAVTGVRDAHPSLGILKLWAQLKTDHPDWAVSEKRFRKALAEAGGTASGAGSSAPKPKGKSKAKADGAELVADTGIDATLDVAALAPKVKAKMFGGTKGKGLVARDALETGEVLWQEDPWIACNDPQLTPHLAAKRLCTHCLTQWEEPAPRLSVECPKCTDAHFCNRLCLSRGRPHASHHDLLCEGVNPASAELHRLVARNEWRSLDMVARIIALWRGARAWGEPGAADEISKRVWEGMARVNMETRERQRADWPSRGDFLTRQWTAGHRAIVDALHPQGEAAARKFHQVLASRAPRARRPTPLTEDEEQRWFSYPSFLELLGMININLEDSGGLYALHAHLNHSCEPNIQVLNLPKSFIPPTSLPAPLPRPRERGTHKLTVLARRPIPRGEELTISYVDPSLERAVRRQSLRDGYGFWCECTRCERERIEAERAERKREKERAERAKQRENGAEKEGAEEKGKEADKDKGDAAAEAKGADLSVTDIAAQLDELAVDDML